jgi:hypothetical protein
MKSKISINSELSKVQQLVNLNKMQEAEALLFNLTQQYNQEGRLAEFYLHHLMMNQQQAQAKSFIENLCDNEAIEHYAHNDLVSILKRAIFLFSFKASNQIAQEIIKRNLHIQDKIILGLLVQFTIEFRDYKQAIDLIEESTDDFASSSDIQEVLLRCYIATGNFTQAQNLIQSCIKQDNVTHAILSQMLSLPAYKEQEDQISSIVDKLQICDKSKRKSNSLPASCLFALAKYYKSLKQHSKAWSYAQEANKLAQPKQRFDLESFKNGLEVIKQIYQKRDSWSDSLSTKKQPPVVLVVGMPRSGTTLLEQNLLKRTDSYSGGETLASEVAYAASVKTNSNGVIVEFNAEEFRRAYLEYFEQFVDFNGSLIIDKVPTNYLYIGLFKLAFPDVKIINIKRKIEDNILSVYFESFHPRFNYTFALADIKLVYREYEDMMSHWYSEFSENIYNLNYEDYVGHHEKINQDILAFLNVPSSEPAQVPIETEERTIIETPNVWLARQAVTAKALDSWHPYYQYLNDLGL